MIGYIIMYDRYSGRSKPHIANTDLVELISAKIQL